MIATLMKDQPAQVQGVEMAGLLHKNLRVNPFSLCQTAGLMQRERLS